MQMETPPRPHRSLKETSLWAKKYAKLSKYCCIRALWWVGGWRGGGRRVVSRGWGPAVAGWPPTNPPTLSPSRWRQQQLAKALQDLTIQFLGFGFWLPSHLSRSLKSSLWTELLVMNFLSNLQHIWGGRVQVIWAMPERKHSFLREVFPNVGLQSHSGFL